MAAHVYFRILRQLEVAHRGQRAVRLAPVHALGAHAHFRGQGEARAGHAQQLGLVCSLDLYRGVDVNPRAVRKCF